MVKRGEFSLCFGGRGTGDCGTRDAGHGARDAGLRGGHFL